MAQPGRPLRLSVRTRTIISNIQTLFDGDSFRVHRSVASGPCWKQMHPPEVAMPGSGITGVGDGGEVETMGVRGSGAAGGPAHGVRLRLITAPACGQHGAGTGEVG